MALLGAAKAAGDRGVIVAQFKRSLDAIHAALDDRGWARSASTARPRWPPASRPLQRAGLVALRLPAFDARGRHRPQPRERQPRAVRLGLEPRRRRPSDGAHLPLRPEAGGDDLAAALGGDRRASTSASSTSRTRRRSGVAAAAAVLPPPSRRTSFRRRSSSSSSSSARRQSATLTRLLAANGRSAELSALLDAADWVPLLTDATLRAALGADPRSCDGPVRGGRRPLPRAPQEARRRADAAARRRVVGGRAQLDDDGLGDAFDDAEFEARSRAARAAAARRRAAARRAAAHRRGRERRGLRRPWSGWMDTV